MIVQIEMGVTLERVQNKFACIIGELCSEPLILSQFAIWVDLRIAEYKAKGAISLECTGNEPDPLWLKGHKSEKTKKTSTEEVHGWNQLGSIPTETLEERLSPVVMKEEPLDIDHAGVFPVSLHRATAQKRRSSDSALSEGQDFVSSIQPPFKHRRTEPSLTSATESNSSYNQTESLMSIIRDKSTESLDGVTVTDSQPVEISLVDDNSQDYSQSLLNDADNDNISVLTSPRTSLPSAGATNQDTDIPAMDPYLYPESYPLRLSTQCIKKRLSNLQDLPQQSVMDISKAVATLQQWLWAKFSENRPLEEISVAELDSYLVQFYPILRRKNGDVYLTGSYQKYRSSLDRYLKIMGYLFSIADPVNFPQSQPMYYLGLQRTRRNLRRRRKKQSAL